MPDSLSSTELLNRRLKIATWALLALRLVCAFSIDLTPQEAYYWNYALHPALSYYDHPPVIAWLVRAGYFLFGKTEIGIRSGAFVTTLLSTWLIYLLATIWFGKRAALWAALLFQLLPLFFVYGVLITPDVPLLFFWLLTLYWLSRAVREERPAFWYFAGIALGFCLLSKYTAVFLLPSAFLFLVTDRRYRAWLLRKEPYLALSIAFILFIPVILWNYEHHWASFAFQVGDRIQQTPRLVREIPHPFRRMAEFLSAQLAVTSPVSLATLILLSGLSLTFAFKERRTDWRFAFSFALPLLLFLLAYSTRSGVKANWPAPGYLSLLIAAYPCYRYMRFNSGARTRLVARYFLRWYSWALPPVYLAAIYHSTVILPAIPVHHWTTGWPELAKVVSAEAQQFEVSRGKKVFVLGLDTHYLASALSFYTDGRHPVFSRNLIGKRALAFEYWPPAIDLTGANALAIDFEPPNTDSLRQYFDSVEQAQRIAIRRGGRFLYYAYLTRCYGYKGIRPGVSAAMLSRSPVDDERSANPGIANHVGSVKHLMLWEMHSAAVRLTFAESAH